VHKYTGPAGARSTRRPATRGSVPAEADWSIFLSAAHGPVGNAVCDVVEQLIACGKVLASLALPLELQAVRSKVALVQRAIAHHVTPQRETRPRRPRCPPAPASATAQSRRRSPAPSSLTPSSLAVRPGLAALRALAWPGALAPLLGRAPCAPLLDRAPF